MPISFTVSGLAATQTICKIFLACSLFLLWLRIAVYAASTESGIFSKISCLPLFLIDWWLSWINSNTSLSYKYVLCSTLVIASRRSDSEAELGFRFGRIFSISSSITRPICFLICSVSFSPTSRIVGKILIRSLNLSTICCNGRLVMRNFSTALCETRELAL